LAQNARRSRELKKKYLINEGQETTNKDIALISKRLKGESRTKGKIIRRSKITELRKLHGCLKKEQNQLMTKGRPRD